MKKYELTSQVVEHNGLVLHRIRALKDFGSIKASEFGGWIESEENLSQDGTAWVFDNAKVSGKAMVSGNAEIHNSALVFDNATVYENAKVRNNARIFNNAIVCENARVFDNARVYGRASVYGKASIYGYATICDTTIVCGNANVNNYAQIYGGANIYGYAFIRGNAVVHGRAKVYGSVDVYGHVDICGDSRVYSKADYIVFKNFWSSERYFTYTRSNNKWKVGCFYGTGEELIKKAYADSEESGKEYERVVRYVESILADEQKDKQLIKKEK